MDDAAPHADAVRAAPATPLLVVDRLSKVYETAAGAPLHVLDEVSFTVDRGQVVAVVGESGTGKSTLLHMLGALDRPTGGRVLFEGEDIFKKDDEALAAFRNRAIGFIFQFHHLLPEFTALENVAMPALIQHRSFEDVHGRAEELLRSLNLGARMHHRPGELSGGEQQRVAVARALMNRPGLVLADEPTGNLDVKTAESLHHELIHLSRTFDQTFIIVTHNPALAEMADRVLRLEDRKVIEAR
ncbi:MAG: ABC transporter ATP-binding protein [Rhodothermales bacterium]